MQEGCGVWAGCWPVSLQVEVQGLSPPCPRTLNFTAVLHLGFVTERAGCSARNVAVLGLDIKLWGFVLSGCIFIILLNFYVSLPCYFGVCWDGAGDVFLLTAGKWLVQLLTQREAHIPVKLEAVSCSGFA